MMIPTAAALLKIYPEEINYNVTAENFLMTVGPDVDSKELGNLYAHGSGDGILGRFSWRSSGPLLGQFPMKISEEPEMYISPDKFKDIFAFIDRKYFDEYYGNGTYVFTPYGEVHPNTDVIDNILYDNLTGAAILKAYGALHFHTLKTEKYNVSLNYTVQFDNVKTAESLIDWQNKVKELPSKMCANLVSKFGSCAVIIASTLMNIVHRAIITKVAGFPIVMTLTRAMPFKVKKITFSIADNAGLVIYPLLLSFMLPWVLLLHNFYN